MSGSVDPVTHNDPYTGGTHLNDVAMIYPMFADGRPFLFPVISAPTGRMSGMTSGSISGAVNRDLPGGIAW